jgi:short-subunit dehydrogenase
VGVDYAREVARRGVNLILVARWADALERVAKVTATGETLYQRMMTMSSAKVANIALKALLARSPLIVIGRLNAFMAWSTPLMPLTLAAAFANQLIKN